MDHARITIFEDLVTMRYILTSTLEVNGHEVVAEAGAMDEAEQLIQTLPGDSFEVAVVDGNLSRGASGCQEGARITKLIHERFPGATVISFSGEGDIEGADVQLSKQAGLFALLGAINEI